MLRRRQGRPARDSGFAASSSVRRKTAPRQSLPCAKGGGSQTRRDCWIVFIQSGEFIKNAPTTSQSAPVTPYTGEPQLAAFFPSTCILHKKALKNHGGYHRGCYFSHITAGRRRRRGNRLRRPYGRRKTGRQRCRPKTGRRRSCPRSARSNRRSRRRGKNRRPCRGVRQRSRRKGRRCGAVWVCGAAWAFGAGEGAAWAAWAARWAQSPRRCGGAA